MPGSGALCARPLRAARRHRLRGGHAQPVRSAESRRPGDPRRRGAHRAAGGAAPAQPRRAGLVRLARRVRGARSTRSRRRSAARSAPAGSSPGGRGRNSLLRNRNRARCPAQVRWPSTSLSPRSSSPRAPTAICRRWSRCLDPTVWGVGTVLADPAPPPQINHGPHDVAVNLLRYLGPGCDGGERSGRSAGAVGLRRATALRRHRADHRRPPGDQDRSHRRPVGAVSSGSPAGFPAGRRRTRRPWRRSPGTCGGSCEPARCARR